MRNVPFATSPSTPTPGGTGLAFESIYVHFPFCSSRCAYCDFFSSVAEEGSSVPEDYCIALRRELVMALSRGAESDISTIYFGGGTPSVLPEELPIGVLQSIRAVAKPPQDAEITIEANPDSVCSTAERPLRLREAGFNRISIGAQSLLERELGLLGRSHTLSDTVHATRAVRRAGFECVSLDLIYALPGQTPEEWKLSLEQACRLEPDHLSCYELSVHEGSTLWQRLSTGEIPSLPSESSSAEMYWIADEFLADQGFTHYEVSSYARGSDRECRHNLSCWSHRGYLGLGASAHSFDGKSRRWWNIRSVGGFIDSVSSGRRPIDGVEDLDGSDLLLEKLMLGLRTSMGVESGLISGSTRADSLARTWADRGLLVDWPADRAIPTVRGMLFADMMARELSDSVRTEGMEKP